MNAVVTDPILLALVESMEVKVNIMDEVRREKELYAKGVKAMAEASNRESM